MNINANYQINGNNDDENKSPIVSVIVPCYNAEAYLERCVNSILKQTMPDFELLLIDDCSTDQTYSLMEKLAERDRRIRLFRTTENSGPGPTRNVGLDAARGEYVMFVDNDDEISRDCLEKSCDVFKKTQADLFCFGAIKINIKTGEKGKVFMTETDTVGGWPAVHMLERGNALPVIWGMVVSRELLTRHKIRFTPTVLEDTLFKYKVLYHCHRFISLNSTMYNYYFDPDSMFHSGRKCHNEKYSFIKGSVTILDYLQTWLEKIKETDSPPEHELYELRRKIFLNTLTLMSSTERALGQEYYELLHKYAVKEFGKKALYIEIIFDLYMRQSRWGDEMEVKLKELGSLVSFYESAEPEFGTFHFRQELTNTILHYPTAEWQNITKTEWYKKYWRMVMSRETNPTIRKKAELLARQIKTSLLSQADAIAKQKAALALMLYADIATVISFIEPEIWPEKLREDFILCYKYSELSEVSQS